MLGAEGCTTIQRGTCVNDCIKYETHDMRADGDASPMLCSGNGGSILIRVPVDFLEEVAVELDLVQ